MANRLKRERSPYLLQHAENPVDWYPWGDEAFAAARREDKPIFLSIGYSTCHWCHVMEHESFEDPAIAGVLNRGFIAVKVDREERPDVDRVYMTFVQATTGAGGWPMSVWLTPDLKPFYGGTYFPPTSRWGRPGFTEVLDNLARVWREDRPRVIESAEELVQKLRDVADVSRPEHAPLAGREAIDAGIAAFAQAYDARHGGFGGGPKFPRPSELLFLLQAWSVTGRLEARRMAIDTLRTMALSGMRDHVGGGFHRYSVDAEWRVPHFEKMLYDQAQLVVACLEAWQASGEAFLAETAEDTLDYVLQDLTSPEGGFFSAEDADSLPAEGSTAGAGEAGSHSGPAKKEGAFYVWTAAEVDALFGADAPIVRRRFGIQDAGNASSDPHGEFTGQNILYVAESVDEIAVRTSRSADEVLRVLVGARQKLFEARAGRPRPHLDDKVLTAWNGLMIAAFARAARLLVASPRRGEWRAAAERAAGVIQQRMWVAGERQLLRRLRDGDAAIGAFCEDYACLTWGLLELYQATGDARWLSWARELTDAQIAKFWDETDAGWFSTTGEDPSVLLRLKEDYDGAEPAAASVTVHNLLTLGHLTGEAAYTERARRSIQRYGAEIGRVARVMPFMLANLARWQSSAIQVVVAGVEGAADTTALETAIAGRYLPSAVHVPVRVGASNVPTAGAPPWLAAMSLRDGKAAAYICRDFTCETPITDPAELEKRLPAPGGARILIG